MKEASKKVKPDLISKGLFDPFRSIYIDNISFYLGIPKYKAVCLLFAKLMD